MSLTPLKIKSVKDADVSGKRVLMRVDFNVPIKDGAAKIILIAHLGRPDGKVVESLKLAPVEKRVRELTQVPFEMHENLRFDPREESNDEAFAKELASLGGVFINEAFADSHRAHASIVGIPKFLPGFMGL